MRHVSSPLTIGQSGSEIINLQQVLLLLISQKILTIQDNGLVNEMRCCEMDKQIFGNATATLVIQFCTQQGITPGTDYLVDKNVAASLNNFVDQFIDYVTISGIVSHISNKTLPFANITVDIMLVSFRNNQLLGTVSIDESGYYTFGFASTAPGGSGMLGIQVIVNIGQTKYPSAIVYEYGQSIAINVQIEDPTVVLVTEYEDVYAALTDAIGQVAIADIDITNPIEVDGLANQTGESESFIIDMVEAATLCNLVISNGNNGNVDADTWQQFFYGLLRQNLPADLEQLLYQPKDMLTRAVNISIVNSIIPVIDPAIIASLIASFSSTIIPVLTASSVKDGGLQGATFNIIFYILKNEQDTNNFLALYTDFVPDDTIVTFWDYLVANDEYVSSISLLQAALTMATLTGNNTAIVVRTIDILKGTPRAGDPSVTVDPNIPQPELLVAFSTANWYTVIDNAQKNDPLNFFYPAGISGDTPQKMNENYAQWIWSNFSGVYPIQYANDQIKNEQETPFPALQAGLDIFLPANPTFDFRTTTIIDLPNFDFTGIQDADAFMHEVATMQRLMYLTSDYPSISALAGNGLISAVHITQQSMPDFVSTYSNTAGGDDAAASIYYAARASVHTSMVMAFSMAQFDMLQFDGVNSQFPPVAAATPAVSATAASFAAATAASLTSTVAPDWRNLFGALDGCNCTECQSVYSPSAYLVDCLKFLNDSNTSIQNELINNRRPDIKNIHLTCSNTNTPVPYIDIVNELLEDLVSTGTYNMYARQTVADAEFQRAMPEYVNTNGEDVTILLPGGSSTTVHINSPYPSLISAAYPWSAPYNYYKREIDTSLDLAGVKPYELLQRFGKYDLIDAWRIGNIFQEYLSITVQEQNIIANAPATVDLYVAYGFKTGTISIPDPATRGSFISVTPANWNTVLSGRVDVFLQQTGLIYLELLELLQCYTLNPLRNLVIQVNSSSYSETTCDLNQLEIANVTTTAAGAHFLSLLFRFVRMARALGWTYYQLDEVLTALGVTDITTETFNDLARIKYIITNLNITPEQACVLWNNINTNSYVDYNSSNLDHLPTQYEEIFRNALIGDINDPAYPFKPLPITVSVSQDTLQSYFSGVLNIGGADLSLLLSNIYAQLGIAPGVDILPDIPFLTAVYREAVLLKSLKLSVTDWLFFKQWIADQAYYGIVAGSTSPYDEYAAPFVDVYTTLRFISFVKLVKNSGISTSQLEYILRDKPTDAVTDDANNAAIAATLTTLRADLLKAWDPVYDSTTDTASATLQSRLLQITDADNAAKLVNIVERPDSGSSVYTAEEQNFISTTLSFFMPGYSVSVLTDPTNVIYLTVVSDRRAYVFNQMQEYVNQNILKPLIITDLAKKYNLADDVAYLLINDCISVSIEIDGVTAMAAAIEAFLLEDFVTGTDEIDRWSTTDYQSQYKVLLLLDKTSLLIGNFGLNLTDVQNIVQLHVLPDVPSISSLPVRTEEDVLPMPVAGQMPVVFRQMENLIRWMVVRAFINPNMPVLYACVGNVAAVAKADTANDIAAAFSMNLDDVDTLIGTTTAGVLAASYYTDYLRPQLYLRIIDCLSMQYLLPATMATLASAAEAIGSPSSQAEANAIIQLVKAQYDTTQWLSVLRPISDKLRVERRDALLNYLLVNPPSPYQYQWYSIDDIYDTMMIDVQMMSCMNSSRILLAISTVQLWVDRILLGLETAYNASTGTYVTITLTNDEARQWANWRRLYRLWEANREIFVYPENYLLPELRDDKTPFFLELEKYLQQNDITDDNVQTAYMTYLDRLDEVSHLEIASMYRETTALYNNADPVASDVLHVFGRTAANPSIFYYRKRVSGAWTPWEKMDAQIDGDHFVSVMWRGRLRLYWLVFTKVTVSGSAAGMRSSDAYSVPQPTQWKIELAWTELQNGIWSARQMGKDPLYSFLLTEEDPMSLDHIHYYAYVRNGYDRCWYLDGALDRQKGNIYFFSQTDADGNLTLFVGESVYRFSGPKMDHMFTDSAYPFPGKYAANDLPGALDILKTDLSYSDNFPSQIGFFTIKYNGLAATVPTNYDYTMFYDLFNFHQYKLAGTPYHYEGTTAAGYAHYPDTTVLQLLGKAPDTDTGKQDGKYILFPKNVPASYPGGSWNGGPKIMMPYFFYKDFDNSFFVEKTITSVTVPITGIFSTRFPLAAQPLTAQTTAATSITLPTIGGYVLGAAVANTRLSVNSGIVLATNTQKLTACLKVSTGVLVSMPLVQYKFNNFYHEKVNDFKEILYTEGLDGLLSRSFVAGLADTIHFSSVYVPTSNVNSTYPTNTVDFDFGSSYGLYNWELFYYIPMLIANQLSQNQQFDDARKWYNYIFNPTAGSSTSVANYWNFTQFYNNATSVPSVMDIMTSSTLASAVSNWAENPFDPDAIARTRISAYMKNTVMKYLDNLIAWGDYLFGQNTQETINEATLLYVLASRLLGRAPVTIPARAVPEVQTYTTLAAAGLNAFSNALVQVESLLLPASTTTSGCNSTPLSTMYYFCLIPNDKLASYWDTVSDRLFKIRNCMTIDGVVEDLPLFAPPIDPALLISAIAAGVSLPAAIAGLNAPLPFYRFNILLQRATEFVQDVKTLGSQLLSALEKKDAEYLSVLQSGLGLSLLNAITTLKQQQVDDATQQIAVLQAQLNISQQALNYYQGLLSGGLNSQETLQLSSMQSVIPQHIAQGVLQTLSGVMYALPQVTVGVFSFGVTEGGLNIGALMGAAASALGTIANYNSDVAAMAGIRGNYLRRQQEWAQQVAVANLQITQVQQQIIGAQIRQQMAQTDLSNHQLQVQNAQTMDTALRTKYTNEDLYNWMIGQISDTYFLAYKLAMDMANRTERSYRNELSLETSSFIQFAYWDSLHSGLLAGEQLSYDIRRMEMSYLDLNKRNYELTKNVSLAALDPDSLIRLKTVKNCQITLPEWLFDMDYPGQYMRRIKSVSISIPGVAGPYTTISCKLSLLNSKYRKNTDMGSGYPEDPAGDDRFIYLFGSIQSVATSHAQNDSGMFELNFRDERYLPFEGAGAISTWAIELPPAYAQFDYNSISDVILHVKYTSFDGSSLTSGANDYVQSVIEGSAATPTSLYRIFNVRSEFATEWQQMLYGTSHLLTLQNLLSRMPYVSQLGTVGVSKLEFYTSDGLTTGPALKFSVTDGTLTVPIAGGDSVSYAPYTQYIADGAFDITQPWNVSIKRTSDNDPVTSSDIKDMWMVIYYNVSL